MSTDWNELAKQYLELSGPPGTFQYGPDLHSRNMAMRDFLGRAASVFPKDNEIALSWFITALKSESQKWFVARLLSVVKPVPRTLLDPLLLAGLSEPNPSTNRAFIQPCVATFGSSEVSARIADLVQNQEVAEPSNMANAMYWAQQIGA
ncbi:hypothetical protein [Solilutibacter silvestris]|uniref:hypothetical protein n=1 Tax=Solilutibacter silvestris TaxID=1645665 RepID=UPI003D33C5BA